MVSMSRRKKLLVCTEGKSCLREDSDKLFKSLKKAVKENDLKDYYKVKKAECLGLCGHGPAIALKPDAVKYGSVSPADCQAILAHHMFSAEPLAALVMKKRKRKKR
jgi:(2Fe-2S) ferredoxin